ncbi:MAG: hypothetical protein J6K00_08005 [Oscillospiraceae bacterium]|nr:hypothetical protein [Oscillospiraceae bacterium]
MKQRFFALAKGKAAGKTDVFSMHFMKPEHNRLQNLFFPVAVDPNF